MKRVSELHSISCFRLNEVAWLKKQIKDGLVIKFRNAP